MTTPNSLWFGDNLDILRRHVADESVDLIYLDPPFNSKRDYNVLFKERSGADSEAQIQAFTDTWRWDQAADHAYHELVTTAPDAVSRMVAALRDLLGTNDLLAYLVNMSIRLVELHRVLKPTGSLYLHCDPTASHYLKIMLDAIFGPTNFRNEIIWQRTSAHGNATNKMAAVHDVLLFYSKTSGFTWNRQFRPYSAQYVTEHFVHSDPDGRLFRRVDLRNPAYRPNLVYEYKGFKPHPNGWAVSREKMEELDREGRLFFPAKGIEGRIRRKLYLDEAPGEPVSDIWEDIPPIHASSSERLGYPTQKPLALLERIIAASSNPGDVVLDPFCGCGTATIAAEKLGRRWIGIDVTYLAIQLVEQRLQDSFPGLEFAIQGVPTDVEGARALFQRDPYSFQFWSLGLVDARPVEGKEKRGSDRGIDGVMVFVDDAQQKPKRVVVSVKGGERFSSAAVRDLRGTMEREQAELSLMITLKEPTREMIREATAAGQYHSEHWGRSYPRMQIATIEDLLAGKQPVLPPMRRTFSRSSAIPEPVQQPGLGM